MNRKQITRAFVIGSMIILGGDYLHAFDGYEHAAVGNYGLYWARLIFDKNHPDGKQTHQADIDATVDDLLDPQSWQRVIQTNSDGQDGKVIGHPDESGRRATYGEMVEVVDFIDSPYECLDQELVFGSPTLQTIRETEKSATAKEIFARETAQDNSRQNVVAKIHSFLSLAQFSHSNDNHFENKALIQYEQWHQEALDLAKGRNLWQALWMESYADHFMEDFFAPGHVRTPRNKNLVDVVSLAMHDHYNRVGQLFTVEEDRLPLSDLEFLRENPGKEESLVGGKVISNAFFGGLKPDKDVGREWLMPEDVASVSVDMFKKAITLYGDDSLKPTSNQSRGYDDMLFVIAATASSILEVLNTYEDISQWKPLDPSRYYWYADFETRGLLMYHRQTVVAAMPFGFYDIRSGKSSQQSQENVDDLRQIENTAEDPTLAEWKPLVLDKVFAVEANYQSLLGANTGSDRLEIDAESLTWGYMLPNHSYINQIGALTGYSYIIGRDSWGQGPFVKFVIPIPEIDLQTYFYEGFRWYYNAEGHVGRPFGGIGLETGYGLYFLRVNVSEENYLKGAAIRQTPAISFGIGFTYTWNRLLQLF